MILWNGLSTQTVPREKQKIQQRQCRAGSLVISALLPHPDEAKGGTLRFGRVVMEPEWVSDPGGFKGLTVSLSCCRI